MTVVEETTPAAAGARALARMAVLVLDDGRRWFEVAAAWQLEDARAVLDSEPDGPRLHFLTRPKGGSKSTDVAGMCIAWLCEQAGPMEEGFAVAADLEQANRLLDKARGFIARDPSLRAELRVEANRIVHVSGARVQALAADVPSVAGRHRSAMVMARAALQALVRRYVPKPQWGTFAAEATALTDQAGKGWEAVGAGVRTFGNRWAHPDPTDNVEPTRSDAKDALDRMEEVLEFTAAMERVGHLYPLNQAEPDVAADLV